MRTEGQASMTKLIVAFLNVASTPKILSPVRTHQVRRCNRTISRYSSAAPVQSYHLTVLTRCVGPVVPSHVKYRSAYQSARDTT